MLNIRKWGTPNTTAAVTNVSGYCDYCNRIITNGNESKAKSILHLNECRTCFYNQTLPNHIMKDKQQRQLFHYDSQRKDFICQICYQGINSSNDLNTHRCYAPNSRN